MMVAAALRAVMVVHLEAAAGALAVAAVKAAARWTAAHATSAHAATHRARRSWTFTP